MVKGGRLPAGGWLTLLAIADCRLQIADCRLQIADCRLQIADCRLQIADCRLQIAEVLSAARSAINFKTRGPFTFAVSRFTTIDLNQSKHVQIIHLTHTRKYLAAGIGANL
jgi:hypothetical protein